MSNFRVCPICGQEIFDNNYHEATLDAIQEAADYLETELPTEYSDIICSNCLHDKGLFDILTACEHCGQVVTNGEITVTHEGSFYCENCRDAKAFYCDHCEEYHDINESYSYDMAYGETWCYNCYMEEGTICDCCAEYISVDNAQYINGIVYCENCFPSALEDQQQDDIDDLIEKYSYKPTPHFFKTDYESSATPLYFGIELEFHTEDTECQIQTARGLLEEIGKQAAPYVPVYLKQDGSLNNGIEIVSHPRTLRAWKKFIKEGFGNILRLLDHTDSGAYIDEDSGLHIHTSKRGMSDPHKIRYHAFIHEYQDFMESIARRRESSYAHYRHIPVEKLKDISQYDRYEAVNWYNDSTVEIRVFKSTFDPAWLLRSIEFCHALYAFTKSHVSIMHIVKGSALGMFFDYVAENKKLYAELFEVTKALNAAGLF